MQTESNISGLIYQLAKLQKYFLNQHLSDLDLNSDQAKVLTFVAAHPGTNQRQISIDLSRGPASVSNLVKRLIQQGLLEKRMAPHSDRERQLFLTEAGKAAATEVHELFQVLEKAFATNVKDPEALTQTLKQLLVALQ
ncbi:winged helix-turn-helix transcriptional regulator [Lacticaseibacillus casei]|nr:MarR family winged helix-turn-helix transcriptional regulator [Lacticaseibacillus casei]TLQ51890.1 winged helix-turn-helix transcriptional regulator [Lacticaseibacillus casei]